MRTSPSRTASCTRVSPRRWSRACGLAATTLMPAGADVLSVEFKVNLLRPAAGVRFIASGRVIKPGNTLMVTQGDLWALPLATSTDSDRVHVATMQATMIRR